MTDKSYVQLRLITQATSNVRSKAYYKAVQALVTQSNRAVKV